MARRLVVSGAILDAEQLPSRWTEYACLKQYRAGMDTDSITKEQEAETHFGDIDDISALLNPAAHFSGPESLEAKITNLCAIDQCLIQELGDSTAAVYRLSGSENTSPMFQNKSARKVISLLSDRIREAIDLLQEEQFMQDELIIFVNHYLIPHTVQAVTMSVGPSSNIWRFLSGHHEPHLTRTLLANFGYAGLLAGSTDVRRALALCSILALAITAYSGSHCSDIGLNMIGGGPESIALAGIPRSKFSLSKRKLKCLNDFVGGPVWVFGNASGEEAHAAQLLVSIKQFNDLWGPLYAVPADKECKELIAIHTDGGIMYASAESDTASWHSKQYTQLHWIQAPPVHRRLSFEKEELRRLIVLYKSREALPQNLKSFPTNRPLLIGRPPESATTSTTLSCDYTSPSLRFGVGTDLMEGFCHNESCELDLNHFGCLNTFRLQAAGVRQSYYAPKEYQVNFNGGQYINFGLQKTWKKRPAITHKTMLLEWFAKPQANTESVRKLLQATVGLELSACTSNARRVTLHEALKLAFPAQLETVERACYTGDSMMISEFLAALYPTGLSHDNQILAFWPLHDGMAEVYKMPDSPQWSALMKDTPESSCFAVLSPQCLTFSSKGCSEYYRRLCSESSTICCEPVLHTTIELNPEAYVQAPLRCRTKIKLTQGQIVIQNETSKAQLAFYERIGPLSRISWCKEFAHRELIGVNHPSPDLVSVCMVDHP